MVDILHVYILHMCIFPSLSIISMCSQGHCVANMLALLELMSPVHYQVLRASFGTAADLEVSYIHTHALSMYMYIHVHVNIIATLRVVLSAIVVT